MPNCIKRCRKQIPCEDCPFENKNASEHLDDLTALSQDLKLYDKHVGSNFDDFLQEEGILEEVEEVGRIKAKNYKELYSHMSNEAILSAETKTSTFLEMIRLNEILEESHDIMNSPEFKDMFEVSKLYWKQRYLDAHQEMELLIQQSIQEGIDDIEAGRYVDGEEAMNNILRRITGDA